MGQKLPWTKTLNAKLGGVALVMFVFTAVLIAGNTAILSAMSGDSRKMNMFAAGATYDYQLLFYAERIAFHHDDEAVRSRAQAALRETMTAMDARFQALLRGDPSQGVPAVDEPTVLAALERAAEDWRTDREPKLERFLAAPAEERARSMEGLRELLSADARNFTQAAHDEQEFLQDEVERAHVLQFAFLAAATLVLAVAVVPIMRSVSARARALADTANRIASGELALSAPVAGTDELMVLGEAFNTMTRNLRRLIETEREAANKNEEHLWLITSLAGLGQAMSGNPSVKELSQGVIAYLCRVLRAQIGALYTIENGGETLRLAGKYAVAENSGVRESFKIGEGLVGQAALEKNRILVEDIPEDGVRVKWGLGEAFPRNLIVVPLVHDDELRGVIEIGSLAGFSKLELELLDRAASGAGLAISSAEMRARLQQLLEESRAQAEELTVQQEELRSVNDRLAEQTRTLGLQKESLLATETVLRQKASELERASRYKSEFLANMSHELRTPLNSSLILARLLVDNKEGNLSTEQVRYAQSIYSAGNDLLALINDILDLSKIEAGKVDLSLDQVRIDRLVNELRQRFEPLAADRNLVLSIVLEPGCPEAIESDAQRVQQILTNLLSNAVKFTERGSIRLLIASSGRRQIAFSVEDTGIGIPVEQHQVIFDAFRQADGTTNRKFGGTGLGLSICRELATLLGGEIRLRSKPGEGSTFTLLIPLRAGGASSSALHPAALDEAAPRPAREPLVAGPVESRGAPAAAAGPFIDDDREKISDPRRTVLIVEDDPVFAEIVRDLAREIEFQCVVARSADEALRLARAYRPVAVVLDIGLPDQSGLTVLEVLKRDPATRHVPIHVVSVHDHRKLAREMGAVGYVLKPVEREELATALRLLKARLSRTTKAVLVVEDDAVQRDAVTRLLAADNVRVEAVATAAEALSQLRSTSFDCVVVDLMLPDVSGFELLDRMIEDEGYSFPPVIVYTARMLSLDEEQQLRRYSKSIIIKGVRSPERLLEEVTLFLHQVEADLSPEKQRMLRLARDREPGFEGKRVLLVEDDVRNIFALTSVLEPKGVAVDIARNGHEALARLSEPPAVDLVLMDIMMPEMDGLTAIREIRKDAKNPRASLPIVALTAKAMPDDRQHCLEAGANDYIAKPIQVDSLLSLLRVWMPR